MGSSDSKILPQGLSYEEIEVAKVLSGYTMEEIIRIHALFLKAKRLEDEERRNDEEAQEVNEVTHTSRHTSMFKGEIVAAKYLMQAIPELDCPLKTRMYKAMNFDGPEDRITFHQAISALMVFNENAPLDEKNKFFFKLVDADGDGQISKTDLKTTLQLVMEESEETIDHIVQETFEEILGDSEGYLTLDDYTSALGDLVQQRCTIFF